MKIDDLETIQGTFIFKNTSNLFSSGLATTFTFSNCIRGSISGRFLSMSLRIKISLDLVTCSNTCLLISIPNNGFNSFWPGEVRKAFTILFLTASKSNIGFKSRSC